MNIHWIQHVEFEGLGCIESWLCENGLSVSCSRLWAGDSFPSLDDVDGLIVMGGPMGIYDDELYPWLAPEKEFIQSILVQDKPILGICLGAQLIADMLGAYVGPGEYKEIGFFPITGSGDHEFSRVLGDRVVFHWHGDTFGIPEGAQRLASSEVTENQAFLYKENVLALQFHLETSEMSLLELYNHGSDEIVEAPFIQHVEEAMAVRFVDGDALADVNELMFGLLERLFSPRAHERSIQSSMGC